MMKIDAYDRRILNALDCNASASLSEIARSIKLGRDLVGYRTKRLVDKGCITCFRSMIDPYMLGFTLFKTYLKLKSKPKVSAQLFSSLQTSPHVFWSARCDGSWDVYFTVLAKSPKDYWYIQQELLEPFHDTILDKELATNISITFFSRGYLANKTGVSFTYGATPEQVELKELEKNILRVISKNARLDAVEISSELSVKPHHIRTAIQRMEKKKIIAGYKIDLNLHVFSRTFYKAKLYANTLSRSEEETLLAHCHRDDSITSLVKQIGNCPFEISVEAESYEHYHKILGRLKEEIAPITRIETLLVREQSERWNPRC